MCKTKLISNQRKKNLLISLLLNNNDVPKEWKNKILGTQNVQQKLS